MSETMRILLISDVHSNLVALQAVLEDARRRGGWDVVWNMGDVVGYGPEPSACIDILAELDARTVAGNHDWGVLQKIPLTEFNYAAALANTWTAQQLSAAHRKFLEDLPLTYQFDQFTLVHGSPRDPIWEYLLEPKEALENYARLETPHAAMGHTHRAVAFALVPETGRCVKVPLTDGMTFRLTEARWMINPGSVGQPRDGDPRAAYAVLEFPDGLVTAYRVDYDIAATQRRIVDVGLPVYLGERLSHGQ